MPQGPRNRLRAGLVTTAAAVALIGATGVPASAQTAGAAANNASSWQVKGVTLVPQSADDFASAATRATIDRLKSDGVNYIGLTYPIYQPDLRSSDIRAGNDTPSMASLRSAIDYAQSIGLKVMLKPHFEEDGARWRFYISPANRATWFDRVQAIQLQLAALKPDALVLGTEMYCTTTDLYDDRFRRECGATPQVSNGAYWTRIINAVRGAGFQGLLTYDAQDEANGITFWPLLDVIAVSGYHELALNTCDASVQQLKDSWAPIEANYYQPLVKKFNKDIMFLEIGYSSSYCSHQHPWQYAGHSGRPDPAEQDKLYQAFFEFWGTKSYIKGVNWWNWRSDPAFGGAANSDYTTRDKPAEKTMARFFGPPVNAAPAPAPAPTRAATPTPTPTTTPTPTPTPPAPAPVPEATRTQGPGGAGAGQGAGVVAPVPTASAPPAVNPSPTATPTATPTPTRGALAPTPAPTQTAPPPTARPTTAPAPVPTTRLSGTRLRPGQRVMVRVANYRPRSLLTISERFTQTRVVNGVRRPYTRTVKLSTVRLLSSGAGHSVVLPVQSARTGRLFVQGTDSRGAAITYSTVIRVG